MNFDIKYILKRVIIGVLIGIILFSIKSCNVKALANTGIFSDLIIPGDDSEGRWYSINSGTLSDSGYSFLSSNDIYYSLPSTPNYYYGNYGGALTLCNMSFITNNYYSVTYTFVSSGYDYVHPYFSAMTYRLGIVNQVSESAVDFNILNASTGWQITSVPGLLPIGGDIFTYTIIFQANAARSCLTSVFTSNSKTLSATELAFVGYKYESLGSQPLTEQQMTTIINNSNQQVINNIQNSANSIINNQNSNSQSIINNQNSNTQSIIDNQNANTDKQIESQQVCNTYDKNSIVLDDKFLTINGNVSSSNGFGVTDFINILNAEITILNPLSFNPGTAFCYYNANKVLISCEYQYNLSQLTIPNNTYFLRATINVNANLPTFQVCQNGNQATYDAIIDESGPNLGGLNNSAGWLPAGPVDSILNLPLTLLNSLNRTLGSTCQPVSLNVPLVNSTLILPCVITLYDDMGITTWVNTIGIIASAFILFSYLAKLYKWVDDTLTFRENNHIDNWGGV